MGDGGGVLVFVIVGGTSVNVGLKVRVGVGVGLGESFRRSRVWVGWKMNEKMEEGVFDSDPDETTRSVTAIVGDEKGMGVEFPVTGMTMGLGIISATISKARAAAVLFMLAKDWSSVLRDCRSRAVGGAGLNPATTKTIQTMPRQIPSAASACRGMANCLTKFRISKKIFAALPAKLPGGQAGIQQVFYRHMTQICANRYNILQAGHDLIIPQLSDFHYAPGGVLNGIQNPISCDPEGAFLRD